MSDRDLALLCQRNMRDWYTRRALAAGGQRRAGWLHVPAGLLPGRWQALLPFPATADAVPREAGDVPLWTTIGAPLCGPDVRAALKSHGFVFAAAALAMARPPGPPAAGAATAWDVRDLAGVPLAAGSLHPSYGPLDDPAAAATWRAARRLAQGSAPVEWLLGAFDGAQLVGSAAVHSDGASAGIYDVATLPAWRGRGVSHALLRAAIALCTRNVPRAPLVLQNDASLEPLYRVHGFRRVGTIEHWSLAPDRANAAAPDASPAAEQLAAAAIVEDLKGLDALLASDPRLATTATGGGTTALHLAAYHGAAGAVARLLAAGADPASRDPDYHGTPLDWALHGLSEGGPVFKRAQLEAAAQLVRAGAPFGAREHDFARQIGSAFLERLEGAAHER